MIQLPSISENTQQEMQKFCEKAKHLDSSKNRTEEEILQANSHLDSIIALLKKEQII